MSNKINQHFYLNGDKFDNDCQICCMHCPYNLDDVDKKWLACSESCLYMIGYSCKNCGKCEYGKKID